MKKLIYASLVIFCFSCSKGSEKKETEESATKTEVAGEKKFACPMKCEGEKTYSAAGKCPVCQMDLQEVALAETDSMAHQH